MAEPQKVRFPLFAKILLWFFLNLLVLAVAGYALFKYQFRVGLDSLLLGQAGARVQAVSEVIAAELDGRPASEWSAILRRFSEAYRVSFTLFRNDGTQAAGAPLTVPDEVRSRLLERGPGGGGGRRGPPAGRGPNRGIDIAAGAEPVASPHPKFMVRTENPVRYWVGVRILSPERESRGPWTMTLLAESPTLGGGGLFFDVWPWVVVGVGALLFSAVFWFPLVRSLTRSLAQMTRATEQIAEGRFDVRMASARRDELGRLGGAINRMAERLAGFVSGQKRFLGDTAHELCSPLARMQMALGILEERLGAEHPDRVEDLREEVQQMSGLVNELLSFSKAALQSGHVPLTPVALREVVEAAVQRETVGDVTVEILVPVELCALAERELLQRSIANLVRNAIRYAGQAGPITISARMDGAQVLLTVEDCGPGVPDEALARLAEPFYRPEASRDRESGGVGLGLAIVKTCIEACRGTVTCRNRSPRGFAVEIRLEHA
jgi:two-component system sensor histidine kinase CpxA